jgi:hypothetical protein
MVGRVPGRLVSAVTALAVVVGLVAVVQVFQQGVDPRFAHAPKQAWGSAANRSHLALAGATEVKPAARTGKRKSGSVLAAPLVGPAARPGVPKGALPAVRPAPKPRVRSSDGRTAKASVLKPLAAPVKGFDPKTSRELAGKRA